MTKGLSLCHPTGRISTWQTYSPLGAVESGSAFSELPAYGYRAEEYNPATGLQYLRARYLDTRTSAFFAPDTYLGAAESPVTLNRYAYALGNPLSFSDPTGHFNLWGAITSFASNVVKTVTKVVKTVVRVVTNVVRTVVNAVTNFVSAVATTAKKTYNYVMTGSTSGKRSGGLVGLARSGWAYAQQKAAEYRQAIERVSCGAAQFLKDTGSAIVEFTASFDLSEVGHTVLDAAGMLPVVGAAADIANGVWYAAEGNYVDAAISFASAVPGAGDAIGAAKLGAKAAATAVSAASGAAALGAKAASTAMSAVSGIASTATAAVGGAAKGGGAAFIGMSGIAGGNKVVKAAKGEKPPSLSPEGAGRNGAYREAKRAAGVPVSQHYWEKTDNIRNGKVEPGSVYVFRKASNQEKLPSPNEKGYYEYSKEDKEKYFTTVREDVNGHTYPDDPTQNRDPHFHAEGSKDHFDY